MTKDEFQTLYQTTYTMFVILKKCMMNFLTLSVVLIKVDLLTCATIERRPWNFFSYFLFWVFFFPAASCRASSNVLWYILIIFLSIF